MVEAVQAFDQIMKPTDSQLQAFKASDQHRFTLYGGAGGGGKSYFLRWWCLRQLLKLYAETGIEGIRVGLFSMDYPTLTDRQISRINREFPEWLGALRKTQSDGYNFQLLPEFGGGTIALRNLDDPSKYRSAEFAVSQSKSSQRTLKRLLTICASASLAWGGATLLCGCN
jgi:phage terminase large subunit